MRAVNKCENFELYPSNEWKPMKMVKHEGRDVGGTRNLSCIGLHYQKFLLKNC